MTTARAKRSEPAPVGFAPIEVPNDRAEQPHFTPIAVDPTALNPAAAVEKEN